MYISGRSRLEPFKIHILGCGSALPTLKHNSSSQVVEVRGKLFMVDCGEGTQIFLRRSHISFTRLQAVFISHLHGDHCFGLIGMISTFGLQGRTAPLHIYAPAALEPMLLQQMEMFCHGLEYKVIFHPVDTTVQAVVYEDRSLQIESVPLNHRMPCCGFLFREKPSLPHIRRDMIDFYGIPVSQIQNIKNGAGWITEEGEVVSHERLVTPADAPRSYAYCSDTKYMPQLCELVKGVDLLYHESTYTEEERDKARLYYHSTAADAARVAKDANVGRLMLGHYSARYDDENVILKEAQAIFTKSFLSDEGMVVDV